MVPNPNYVPASTATTPPPSTQQPTVSAMSPLATDAVMPKSFHGSQPADAPLPSPIIRMTIWLDWRTS
ncbi:uncharacterized protein DS421_1g30830 [Arachis hypogaea]|nr:uncharacterized protein DS421_1g30830 [Arachis hypogaea]